jgi:hypothetical protein
MSKINEILDYGLLAEFAYITLESDYYRNEGLFKNDDGKIIYNNENIIKYLTATEKEIEDFFQGNEDLIKTQKERDFWDNFKTNYEDTYEYKGTSKDRIANMLNLLNDYEVVDFTSDDEHWYSSDFQAMLLQNISTKKYVIAFRGTAGLKDVLVDSQLALLTDNHNYQLKKALGFVTKMKDEYGLSSSNLTFTGHSLGAILAQAIGAKLKIPAFAYNPLGTSKLEVGNGTYYPTFLVKIFIRLKIDKEIDENWVNKNIITISYNDVGLLNGDILSNLASKLNASKHLGIKIDIFGKDVGLGAGHSIITLNKVLEKEDENELTTIEDIKNYNQKQKTLFLNIVLQKKLDILISIANHQRVNLSVQTYQMMKPIIESQIKDLIEQLNHANMESFMINANIKRVATKDDFDKKLYYNFKKNELKLKTKDFKEAAEIVNLIINENNNLKKHDIEVALEGSD